jgi:hypothetical protein
MAPIIINHPNHSSGTSHLNKAAAARRKITPLNMLNIGVIVLRRSPAGIKVRVSRAKGHISLPPTHHGGGISPGSSGTSAVRLKWAPSNTKTRLIIHIFNLLLLLFNRIDVYPLLFESGSGLHNCYMTIFVHWFFSSLRNVKEEEYIFLNQVEGVNPDCNHNCCSADHLNWIECHI